MELVHCPEQRDPGSIRLECIAVGDLYVDAIQLRSGQLRRSAVKGFLFRSEFDWIEHNTRQPQIIEELRRSSVVEPRSSDVLERLLASSSFREIGRLDEAGSDVREQRFKREKVWRRLAPGQPCLIVPHGAFPSEHRHHAQPHLLPAAELSLFIIEARQLAHRHPVHDRNFRV